MSGNYLGPSFNDREITKDLKNNNAIFEILDEDANKLGSRETNFWPKIGWFQDRMEFGPRALGNRSILADPRSIICNVI